MAGIPEKMKHPFEIYSEQVLSFRLGETDRAQEFSPAVDAEKTAARHLGIADKRKAGTLILFGLGDGRLARTISRIKPSALEFIICDLNPDHVRKTAAQPDNLFSGAANTIILCDSSMWALLLLLHQNGYRAEDCHLLLNPDLKGNSRTKNRNLQRVFSGLKGMDLPQPHSDPPVSAGAILSPDEPGLQDYISSLPGWLNEIVLIWDCDTPSGHPQPVHPEGVKIINSCHPLEADFGAQRNRMLEKCSADWIVYLDADERLDEASWSTLRRAASTSTCEGWYLPRITYYPDRNHCRSGYGLWPDLQLRFFRNTRRLNFVNRIHERINGISGPYGILPGSAIAHLTHLLKSRRKIESKLESFNMAAEGQFTHRLGAEYPNVPCELLYPVKSGLLPAVILPEISLQ